MVATGAVYQSRHYHPLTFMLDGVTRKGLTTADEHLVIVLRILESHNVATIDRMSSYARITDKAVVAAYTQTVAPTVHQHTVAFAQQRRECLTIHSADSEHHGPEAEHQKKGQGQGYEKLRSLAQGSSFSCDKIATDSTI